MSAQRIEPCVRTGLSERQFQVFYQPQIYTRSGGLCGFEALLRWQNPDLGRVSPETFIGVAERSGAIHDLGAFALGQALDHAAELRAMMQRPLHVAVNVSPYQLRAPGFEGKVVGALKASNIGADAIHVEITESALLDPDGVGVGNVQALADAGIPIWIDDFGTGYSSLRLLRDLPLSGIKIDRSFISELDWNQSDFRIVSAIIAMSHSLRLGVVAEGIETEAQLETLEQLGCDVVQGYLIGKPSCFDDTLEQWSVLAA